MEVAPHDAARRTGQVKEMFLWQGPLLPTLPADTDTALDYWKTCRRRTMGQWRVHAETSKQHLPLQNVSSMVLEKSFRWQPSSTHAGGTYEQGVVSHCYGELSCRVHMTHFGHLGTLKDGGVRDTVGTGGAAEGRNQYPVDWEAPFER
ncbi:Uu.00g081360.m01.CDS01 [Anthostomella pinea]|uniref:Uu.00g081360.m01.CDS01 n=1 Tax=Anthostomella pinea TaxID=933095 RepID=A0AAI8VL59_9PEZI|nr:Uu.00g081360.m01.CDS01 [Anthostomella pinea]